MLTIRYGGRSAEGYDLSRTARLTFHDDAGELLGRVSIALSPRASEVLMHELGGDSDRVVIDALLMYGLRRAETTLTDERAQQLLLAAAATDARWPLDIEDLDELKALLTTKRCDYQVEEGRDLYCTAAMADDPTAIGSAGLMTIAPTSRVLCSGCGMPDSTVLCSHLLHPEVYGITGSGKLLRRDLAEAICDRDRDEVNQPGQCQAGGNGCWERAIRDTRAAPAELPTEALPDALDAFDTSWRLVFGRHRRLLTLRSATTVAGLGQPVIDRESFRGRVDDLEDIISGFHVDGDLLPDNLSDDRRKGSLNKLAAALERRGSDRAEELVAPLRAVVALRNAQTHSGAASRARQHATTMGFDWPPRDWRDAWNRVRVVTVNALRDLRHALDSIEREGQD